MTILTLFELVKPLKTDRKSIVVSDSLDITSGSRLKRPFVPKYSWDLKDPSHDFCPPHPPSPPPKLVKQCGPQHPPPPPLPPQVFPVFFKSRNRFLYNKLFF